MFFSLQSPGGYAYRVAPATLRLVYVRPPPVPQMTHVPTYISSTQFAQVHTAFYRNGMTILAQSISDETDRVSGIAFESGIMSKTEPKQITESLSVIEINGRIWSVCEAPSPLSVAFNINVDIAGAYLNELVTQLEYPNRKLYLLTNMGLTTIIKKRPLEILLSILQNNAEIQDFQKVFGKDQICAMCLAIACGHPSVSSGPYGIMKDSKATASKLFFDLGGYPAVAPQMASSVGGRSGILRTTTDVILSPKHNGLALYLSRLLRPIWKKQVFKSVSLNGDFFLVNQNLTSLDTLLTTFPNFTSPPSLDSRPLSADPEAWRKEQQSLADLHSLIKQSRELISLITLLLDFKIENISGQKLPDVNQVTFETLVTTEQGREYSKALMVGLVNSHIDREGGADTIIDTLKRNCPTICESNDTVIFKVLNLV